MLLLGSVEVGVQTGVGEEWWADDSAVAEEADNLAGGQDKADERGQRCRCGSAQFARLAVCKGGEDGDEADDNDDDNTGERRRRRR